MSGFLAAVSLWGVLSYSVLGRMPSGNHRFAWYNHDSDWFIREMFMNVLLYVPLGATLAELFGPWSTVVGLFLSVGVEVWQYSAGTGLAQGTDIICNSLGCAIGLLPHLVTEAYRPRIARAVETVRLANCRRREKGHP